MRIPIVLAALGIVGTLCARSTEARACVIDADNANIDELVISPIGEESVKLTVRNLPLQVRPGAEGQAEVTLLAPLAFATTHSIHSLDIRVAKPTSLLDGRITLAKGGLPHFPDSPRAPGSESVEAKLPLFELEAETPIRVPCASLTVGNGRHNREAPELSLPNTTIRFIQSPTHLPLYAQPKEESPFWMSFAGPLRVVSSHEGWLEVKAEWTDGSILRGWVPETLARVESGRPELGLHGLGTLGIGGCGRSHGPSLNAFKLRVGAPIHSAAKGAIWAHAASAINVQAFALNRSDGWIRIASLEGLPPGPCSEHSKIWVHARDLDWTEKPL